MGSLYVITIFVPKDLYIVMDKATSNEILLIQYTQKKQLDGAIKHTQSHLLVLKMMTLSDTF